MNQLSDMEKTMLAVELLEVLAEFVGSNLTPDTPLRVKAVLTSWTGHRYPGKVNPETIKVTAGGQSLYVDIPELRGVLSSAGPSAPNPSAPRGGDGSGAGSEGV